jgi:ABC-type nitrate/sulfonate/bicarbonate transport system substrate-binding protein
MHRRIPAHWTGEDEGAEMRLKRLGVAVASLLIGAVVLTACSSSGSSGSGGTTAAAAAAGSSTSADSKGTIVVAAPECAHCVAMYLLGGKIPGYKVKYEQFATLTDLAASLASGKVDIGQIDYTGLVSMIDKGLPLVAISGEVNGGSDFVVSPKITLTPNDWAAFKTLVDQRKAAGKELKIASQFGTVQDIELRLQLPKEGIDVNKDVDFVNVPYQGMAQALKNGSVDAAIPVQPVAAQITGSKTGVHFAYPYDQAAGDLTNVVVVNKAYMTAHPDRIAAALQGMNALVPYLSTPAGQADWAATIEKYTGADATDTAAAMAQLKPAIGMPFTQIQAIAHAMFEQKLITQDLSAAVLQQHVDYTGLATATGKTPAELGAPS